MNPWDGWARRAAPLGGALGDLGDDGEGQFDETQRPAPRRLVPIVARHAQAVAHARHITSWSGADTRAKGSEPAEAKKSRVSCGVCASCRWSCRVVCFVACVVANALGEVLIPLRVGGPLDYGRSQHLATQCDHTIRIRHRASCQPHVASPSVHSRATHTHTHAHTHTRTHTRTHARTHAHTTPHTPHTHTILTCGQQVLALVHEDLEQAARLGARLGGLPGASCTCRVSVAIAARARGITHNEAARTDGWR
jgi:hypothetical protein